MFRYIYKDKRSVFLFCILSILTYTTLIFIFESYSLITGIASRRNLSDGYKVTLFCLLVLVCLLGLLCLTSFIMRRALYRTTTSLRQDVFDQIFNMDISQCLEQGSSSYSSILLNDLEILENDYFSSILNLLGDIIQIIVTLGSIAMMGFQYVLMIIFLSIPTSLEPLMMKGTLGKYGRIFSESLSKITKVVNNFIHSFELIRSFRAEGKFSEQFESETKKVESTRFKSNFVKGIDSTLVLFVVYFMKVVSQLAFVNTALKGVITAAMVTTLFGLANNVANPASNILDYVSSINSTGKIREKIFRFLNAKPAAREENETISKVNDFVCKDLSFSYDKKYQVLRQINMHFEAGKKYLILGESGCGKSTLLKLLSGYYSDYGGELLIDGDQINRYKQSSLFERFAVITQNVSIFTGTIEDNITMFSTSEYTPKEIDEAIEKAGLSHLVTSLESGKQTIIEEGGQNFSGGEKQRIAIARAIIRKPDVIFVDEGTSALDNITAVHVEKTILSLEGIMVIAISHRINRAVLGYDQLYVMDGGKVKLRGKYDELHLKGLLGNFEYYDREESVK